MNKVNPLILSFYWCAIVLTIGALVGIISNQNASGGEQMLLTSLSYSIIISLIGVLFINIMSIFFYRNTFRSTIIYSKILAIITLIILIVLFNAFFGEHFNFSETVIIQGSDRILIKTEYYDEIDEKARVRSLSYWKNGRKDSIWTTYAKDGSIISIVVYKNGSESVKIK